MLQFVLGRAGYGKTAFIKEKIEADITRGEKNILLLVPEQFSFVTGNTFLSLLGPSKYIDLEITDFTRLAHEVQNKYGGAAKPLLSKGGKAVLMQRAINGVQDYLTLYKKNLNKQSFIASMLQMHTELKCCDIAPSLLAEAEETVEKTLLKNKLHDVSLIMQAYEALLSQRFSDAADELNRLYSTLLKVDYLKGRIVYIDGFDGFTAQELHIIERMMVDAVSVTITLPTDSITLSGGDFSVFTNVKRTARQLLHKAKKNNINVLPPIKLNEPFRFQNQELRHLEQNFMAPDFETAGSEGKIHLYQAKNIYEECNAVCRTIKKLLRTGSYRCRDIALITRDISAYQLPLENAFRSYDLPYFEDRRQPVDSQPLINLVRYAMRAVNTSFRTDEVLAYAKTMLTGLTTDEIAELENYVILWRISGTKWTAPFENHPSGFAGTFNEKEKRLLKQINQTRETLIRPLIHFKTAVQDTDGEHICKAIFTLLTELKADRYLMKIARQLEEENNFALAEEQNRIWELLMDMLDQIVLTMGKEPVPLKAFEELFELILSFQDLGSIPQGLDNITVGSADRAIADKLKVVFLLGTSEGAFPKTFSSTGLFNDRDRQELERIDIHLFSDTARLALQEKFIAYSAVTLPSEQLYVSYCSSNLQGNSQSPSVIVEQIQAMFPDLQLESLCQIPDLEQLEGERAAFELLASRWQENSGFINGLKAYFQKNEAYQDAVAAIVRQRDQQPFRIHEQETATALFGRDMVISASRAEAYYQCPFLYFCKFGLGAKPRRVAEMDPMQTGTVMHYVLEKLLAFYGSQGLIALPDAERCKQVDRLLEQYLKEEMGVFDTATPRFRYLFLRLQKTINLVVAHMVEEFSQSEFVTKAYELKIDQDAEIKAMQILLPDGGSLIIRGSVDRVDLMEKDEKKYLRVVDYKSGIKDFSLSDVLYGLNMQMLIYLFCMSESDHPDYGSAIPSGVLYMPVRRTVSNLTRDASPEEAAVNNAKELKMKGILLNDLDALKGMERDLKGRYIPVKSGKEISGSLISAEQIGKLSVKIKDLLAEMGQRLHEGKIGMFPVKGKNYEHTCDFCDYQSVCMNKLEKSERILTDFDHAEALSALEKERESID